jgi:hypothetical protein
VGTLYIKRRNSSDLGFRPASQPRSRKSGDNIRATDVFGDWGGEGEPVGSLVFPLSGLSKAFR